MSHNRIQFVWHYRFVPYFAAWIIAMVLISGSVQIPEEKLQLTVVYGFLYAFPGLLSADLLNLWRRWSRMQYLALGLGLGFAEALVIGQVCVLLGLPVEVAAYSILAVACIKLIVIARLKTLDIPRFRGSDFATLAQIIVALLGLLTLLNTIRQHDVYTWRPIDAWNYLQVQVQLSENPGNLNIQDGLTVNGINYRLLWNSWLYNKAMIDSVAGVDPVISQQRDSLFFFSIIAGVVYVALGRELLHDRQASWMAALFQAGFMISATGQLGLFTLRLVEDKFFSFFIYIPLIYLITLRLLRYPSRSSALIFGLLTVTAALIHPVNPVFIFITIVPVVGLNWLSRQKSLQIPRGAPLWIVVWLGLLLLYPLGIQGIVQNIPQTSSTVGDVLSRNRNNTTWLYTVNENVEEFSWHYAMNQNDYRLSLLVLTPVMLLALWRFPRKLALHFMVGMSAVIIVLLWLPPFAVLAAKLLTTSQNWRIFMLLPVGYAWAWAALWLWDSLQSRWKIPPRPGRILWGVSIALAAVLIWDWPGRIPTAHQPPLGMTSSEIAAFHDNREQVDDSYVLSTPELSKVMFTLWPDAQIYFSLRPRPDVESQRELTALLELEGTPDPLRLLQRYDIEYVLLPDDIPLAGWLNRNPQCVSVIYTHETLKLYKVCAL